MAYYTAGIVGSYFRGATTPNGFDISGTTVRASNLLAATTIRDTAGTLDISGGNITVTGVINAGAIASSGISPTNIIVPGYVRDTITPTTLDISGGNISNSGTTRTANAIVSGYLRNALTATQFDISGGNISNSATTRSSNFIGTSTASNQIGGVTLSNLDICMSSTGRILAPILRNAVTATTYDISGGNISNSGTTQSSNFIGTSTASNNLGGVSLSNRFVGVGIPNPTVQLDISGTVRVSASPEANIRVAAAGASDLNALTVYQLASEQGFYTSNTTPLTLYTQGVRRLTILSNGNVGIGTINPGYTLEVTGTAATSNALVSGYLRNALTPTTYDISGGNISNSGRITNGPGTVSAPSYTFGNDVSMGLYDPATNVLGIVTAGVERMRIDPNGNAGIGTTSNALSNYRLTIRGTGGTTGGIVFGYSTNPIPFVGMVYDETNDTIGFRTNTGAADLNYNAMAVTRTTGRVGIGTVAPAYALDVSSTDNAATAIFRNPSANQAAIWVTQGAGAAYSDGFEMYQTSGEQGLYAGLTNTRPINFWTQANRRMTILSNGNVGVNNSNPAYTFDVTSSAASSASINMTTWPRTSGAIVYAGTLSSRSTDVITLTQSTAISSSLVTVGSASGTFFVINKSGIYAVQAYTTGPATSTWFLRFVASTTSNFTSYAPTPATIVASSTFTNAIGEGTISYVGYLASNAALYYKLAVTTGLNPSSVAFSLTYLGEMP